MAPQIIWIVITTLGISSACFKHGHPKDGVESAWITMFASVLNWGLMYWGGFFDAMGGG